MLQITSYSGKRIQETQLWYIKFAKRKKLFAVLRFLDLTQASGSEASSDAGSASDSASGSASGSASTSGSAVSFSTN